MLAGKLLKAVMAGFGKPLAPVKGLTVALLTHTLVQQRCVQCNSLDLEYATAPSRKLTKGQTP
jgi:hypothetical protein